MVLSRGGHRHPRELQHTPTPEACTLLRVATTALLGLACAMEPASRGLLCGSGLSQVGTAMGVLAMSWCGMAQHSMARYSSTRAAGTPPCCCPGRWVLRGRLCPAAVVGCGAERPCLQLLGENRAQSGHRLVSPLRLGNRTMRCLLEMGTNASP